MVKKMFRSLILGIVVFAVSLLAGYLSYMLTYRYQAQKVLEQLPPNDAVSAAAVSVAGPLDTRQHYLARMENGKIVIYAVTDDTESFLYTLDIRAGELPPGDLAELRQGIVLTNRQELASFEEDFNS
ncbi:MAG: hypothetical protein IJB80_01750 [Clostridia bacterium]|nr:hypothetical protein [Clostridia bacterium]